MMGVFTSSIHGPSFFLGIGLSCSIALISFAFQLRPKNSSLHDDDEGEAVGVDRQTPIRYATQSLTDTTLFDAPDLDLRLIRKAEAVIRWRTSALMLIVERCTNDHNYSAILRTAEALGIQHVWLVDPQTQANETRAEPNSIGAYPQPRLTAQEIEQRHMHKLFAQNATEWLTIRNFQTTTECLAACRMEGWEVWVTDLSQVAVPLDTWNLQQKKKWPLPAKIALVMGTEAVGCSQEMLDGADLRIYLPLRGFADSLNLSVASALVVHHMFLLDPSLIGNMAEEERHELRTLWFPKLARQRLLSAGTKRKRKELIAKIQQYEILEKRMNKGVRLHKTQIDSIAQLDGLRTALKTLEVGNDYCSSAVDDAVADLIASPPHPLTDLRRADAHRVTFAGKNTKKANASFWKNMPAVQKYETPKLSTAAFIRDRMLSIISSSADGNP